MDASNREDIIERQMGGRVQVTDEEGRLVAKPFLRPRLEELLWIADQMSGATVDLEGVTDPSPSSDDR